MIYIFGSTGMLGSYLKKQFPDAKCFSSVNFDVSNITYMDIHEKLYDVRRNDVIINAAGVIPQSDKTEYMRVNCDFPILLGNFCRVKGVQCIHISTDCVYSGKRGKYTEDDIPDSTHAYGVSKSLGDECYAQIITTSIIGEELTHKYSLLEWVKKNKNMTVHGYVHHKWNGMTCLQLSKIIKEVIDYNITWIGKRHVYSPREVTKYELVKMISDEFNLNVNVVEYETDVKDMTLSSIFDIQFSIPDIKQQIQELTTVNLE